MNKKKEIIVSLKAGLGFGGAITAYALTGIRMTMSIIPAITFAICAVILFFYSIDKKLEIQITDELTERRKAFQQ